MGLQKGVQSYYDDLERFGGWSFKKEFLSSVSVAKLDHSMLKCWITILSLKKFSMWKYKCMKMHEIFEYYSLFFVLENSWHATLKTLISPRIFEISNYEYWDYRPIL